MSVRSAILACLCASLLALPQPARATDLEALGFDTSPPPLPPRYLDRRWDQEGKSIGACTGAARAVLMALTFVDVSDEEAMILHGPDLMELEKLARGGLKKGEEAFQQRLSILVRHKDHLANYLGGYIEAEHSWFSKGYDWSREPPKSLVKEGNKQLERCNSVKRIL